MGVITVPDERLTKLVEIVQPKSIVPNTIEIVDIAGLVKGASKGEGLGNQFLGNIRATNAILHVLIMLYTLMVVLTLSVTKRSLIPSYN